MARLPEAERLARHRAEMQLAMAEGLSLPEARSKMAWRRWQASNRAREARRERCGTATATCRPVDAPTPRYWWQDQ